MHRQTYALTVSLLFVSVGCGNPDAERVGVVKQQIMNGTIDDSNMFPEVVYLRGPKVGGDGWRCSGTLITPRVVLTAVHCIEDAVGGTQASGDRHFLGSTATPQ